ncbi:MAG TPA: hypothetical protein VEA15_02550 [Caulobacteraceae bacterium]|nr:hypothetical protein [Caulobacteraceae bacterium]
MSSRPSSLIRAVAVALAVALVAAPTVAQAPRVPPDFHARVFLAGFERQIEVRQSGLKRRIDVATGGIVQSFISDRTRGALVVMTAAGRRRVAFLFPLAAAEVNAPVPLDVAQFSAARLTRMGSSTVAGRPCQLHRYAGYLGRSGVICTTTDGLVLQLTPDGRKSPLFQVMSITYARQEPRWFTPPPDYQLSALPGVGGIAVRPQASTSR